MEPVKPSREALADLIAGKCIDRVVDFDTGYLRVRFTDGSWLEVGHGELGLDVYAYEQPGGG